jgi:hypothetical protein
MAVAGRSVHGWLRESRYETEMLAYYTTPAGERTYHILEAGLHNASTLTRAASTSTPSHNADRLRVCAYGWRDRRECGQTAGAMVLVLKLAGKLKPPLLAEDET